MMKSRFALLFASVITLAVFSMACTHLSTAGYYFRTTSRTYIDKARTYRIDEEPISQAQRMGVRPETWNRRNVEVPLPDGNILRGIAIMRRTSRANAIYFGGDGELAQAATTRITQLGEKYNINVIFVDYRGYGASSGLTAIKNMPDDALHVFDKTSGLRGEIPTIVIGFSMGSIPATYLAAHRPVQGLVLMAPISGFEDKSMYPLDRKISVLPWYLAPFAPLVKIKPGFEVLRNSEPVHQIPRVAAPLLLIHGEADQVIPVSCGKKIHELARGNKMLLLIPGLGHDELSLMENPGASFMTRFMDEYIGPSVIDSDVFGVD